MLLHFTRNALDGRVAPPLGDRAMEFSTDYETSAPSIAALFEAVFSVSEGAEEGALIGDLARRMMAETPEADLRVFTAWVDGALVGAILFSRLVYQGDERSVFVLGPVAVAEERQGRGIGQGIIRHGLDMLRAEDVDVGMTYGDPNYYARLGFAPVSEHDIPAPFALRHPEGWLGQSLNEAPLVPFHGSPRCVGAFNDPVFW